MFPYVGPEFVRALLGLDACEGAVDARLDLDGAKSPVTPAKVKGTFSITPSDPIKRETPTTPPRGRSVVFSLWDRLVHWLNKHTGAREL
jgi:hypothetical protein